MIYMFLEKLKFYFVKFAIFVLLFRCTHCASYYTQHTNIDEPWMPCIDYLRARVGSFQTLEPSCLSKVQTIFFTKGKDEKYGGTVYISSFLFNVDIISCLLFGRKRLYTCTCVFRLFCKRLTRQHQLQLDMFVQSSSYQRQYTRRFYKKKLFSIIGDENKKGKCT